MIEIGAPDKYNPTAAHFPASYLNELDKGGGNEE
jgi:hypothetical protein